MSLNQLYIHVGKKKEKKKDKEKKDKKEKEKKEWRCENWMKGEGYENREKYRKMRGRGEGWTVEDF